MGIDIYHERRQDGHLEYECDSIWKDKYKKLKKENRFMESLLTVEQRRKLREYRTARDS